MAMKLLPPGFRFHPTDVELLKYYLKRKITSRPLHFEAIGEVGIYQFDPWELPSFSSLKTDDQKWYFFCPREKRYSHGDRTKRSTKGGFWKTTGRDRPVKYDDETVGMIKTLIFHEGRAPGGSRTDWVMHEYRLEDRDLAAKGISQDTYVICAVFKKKGPGPNNGAQYGALFREEEWEDDEISCVLPSDLVTVASVSIKAPAPPCNEQQDHCSMCFYEANDYVPESVTVVGSPPPVFAASETMLHEPSVMAPSSANAIISHADESMRQTAHHDPSSDGMDIDELFAIINTSPQDNGNQDNQPPGADPNVGSTVAATAADGNAIFADLPDLGSVLVGTGCSSFGFDYTHPYNFQSHDFLELLDLRPPDLTDSSTSLENFQGVEVDAIFFDNDSQLNGMWTGSCRYENNGKFNYPK